MRRERRLWEHHVSYSHKRENSAGQGFICSNNNPQCTCGLVVTTPIMAMEQLQEGSRRWERKRCRISRENQRPLKLITDIEKAIKWEEERLNRDLFSIGIKLIILIVNNYHSLWASATHAYHITTSTYIGKYWNPRTRLFKLEVAFQVTHVKLFSTKNREFEMWGLSNFMRITELPSGRRNPSPCWPPACLGAYLPRE